MSTNFPGSFDSYTTLVDNVDSVLAAQMNDRGSAIIALEEKVGLTNSSTATSLDWFLRNASGSYRTHTHDGSSDDGANIPVANITGTLPVNKGGTGSATLNTVTLTGDQTVAGHKTFSDDPTFSAGMTLGDNANFAQKQAVSLVIENRTSDPSTPVAGQIWFRTDV